MTVGTLNGRENTVKAVFSNAVDPALRGKYVMYVSHYKKSINGYGWYCTSNVSAMYLPLHCHSTTGK